MMLSSDIFSFSIPQNIVVGEGSLRRLPKLAKELHREKRLYYFRSPSETDWYGGQMPSGACQGRHGK